MALRQAASALVAWNTRLGGSLAQQASVAAGAGLQQQEHQRGSSADAPATNAQVAAFATSAKGQALLSQHRMDATCPQTPLLGGLTTLRHMSSALLRSQQRLPGLQTAAQASLRMPQLPGQPQRRSYTAWSPAQRYFVEGDHVIQAEANRSIQFTGLDAGSFYPFVVYTLLATTISLVFVVLPLVVAPSRVDLDKSSAYECGFDAFGEARQTFSVSFYLVSIMYLLFDIEIAYLFPYVMTHANAPMFWTMNLFLGILVAGFVYEWGVGALEWRDSEAD